MPDQEFPVFVLTHSVPAALVQIIVERETKQIDWRPLPSGFSPLVENEIPSNLNRAFANPLPPFIPVDEDFPIHQYFPESTTAEVTYRGLFGSNDHVPVAPLDE